MSEPISYFEHAKALANAAAPIPPGEDNMNAHGQAYEMPVSPGARVNCANADRLAQLLIKHGLVDENAWYDSEGYDGGRTADRVRELAESLR